jgi:hypothetical protein
LVKVGAQRIFGEQSLPNARRELLDQRCGVLAHALQDIDQVVVRIDIVQVLADMLGGVFL